MDEEDYDDEDIYTIRHISCQPFSFWAIISFFLNLLIGAARTVFTAVDQLNDEVLGAKGYSAIKKDFADQARAEIEAIPVTDTPE